jgi:imidazolonepropionase-like amidohydrolase
MINERTIITNSYFDGTRYHKQGPYTVQCHRGHILDILPGIHPVGEQISWVEFIMPGLVEGHCHLFLNGGELDLDQRSGYLKTGFDQMMAVARRNVKELRQAGVTLARDAGDRFGVNHAIREETRNLEIRSAGMALRGCKRYGSFMALEVKIPQEIIKAVREFSGMSDDLKILQSGIIDFAAGTVKGKPQFDLEQLNLMVATAGELGLKTFAHCSGREGLEIAIEAGVDSIEHGFFITEELLQKMAETEIAWVPTFSPVHFQWEHPEIVGWDQQTVGNLRSILDHHLASVAAAFKYGVNLIAGSDAGSQGVDHGRGLIDEIFLFLQAGLPLAAALQTATSIPRKLWGAEAADLQKGNVTNFIMLAGSPFQDVENLRRVREVVTSDTLPISVKVGGKSSLQN